MSVSFDYKKKLGEGHFGEVWLVVETGLNFTCAVKRIPINKVMDPDNFFHEAQILKEAEHPNTICVYDTGYYGEHEIYLTMEYLEAGSLEDEAQGAFLKLSRSREVMIDVLRGLDHAHSKGIIHRDIKPANILIGRRNEAILSDFGLAISNPTSIGSNSNLKAYEYLLHLAPEITSTNCLDSLSDIYACGVTMYRLVNGDIYLPKVDPATAQRLAKRGEFPDRTKYREFVPRQLRAVINKAMAIDPDKRYPTANSMRRALEQIALEIDWEENRIANGYRWTGTQKKTIFQVSRTIDPQTGIEVVVKKGRSLQSMRKMPQLSRLFSNLEKAEAFTKKVFQDLTVK